MKWFGRLFKFDNTISTNNEFYHDDGSKNIEPIDLMKVKFVASPNKSNRRNGQIPSHIVLHHTGPGSFNGIVKWLCNSNAKASAHYVVGTDGQLKQLVNTMKKAWHAGRSGWAGSSDVNNFTIGIEICNIGLMEKRDDGFYYEQGRKMVKYTGELVPSHSYIEYTNGKMLDGWFVPYPDKQIDKLVALCKALVKKYPGITRDHIITHFQVAFPPGRKNDPFGLDIEKIKDMIFEE
jgi:N-acetylmuramoyl-L-alanine amidase